MAPIIARISHKVSTAAAQRPMFAAVLIYAVRKLGPLNRARSMYGGEALTGVAGVNR
jgi:CBS-domain-containing membrane protein